MNDDINTKRTELANQMAATGAALLDFTGTAAALAAIPDTEPQQYVAAGTPENIAAILPATITPQRRQKHGERPTEPLQWDDAATSGDAPTDLQQLKALALAATPGPWAKGYGTGVTGTRAAASCSWDCTGVRSLPVRKGKEVIAFVAAFEPSEESMQEMEHDARYIAAANPAVVLGLIARIESVAAPALCEQGPMHIAPPPFELTLPELAEEFRDVAAHGGTYTLSARNCEKLYEAMTTPPDASPATASGDELPSLPAAEYKLSADSKAASLYDLEAVQSIQREAYELGKARAAVSAAKVQTASGDELPPPKARATEYFSDEPVYSAAEVLEIRRAAVSAATKPTADEPLLRQWQQFHSAMSQCAELLDNMSDGESLFDTPKFLAAKLAGLAPISAPLDLNSLTRYSMWSNGSAYGCDPSPNGRWVEFDDVQSLLATKPAAAPDVDDLSQFIRKVDGNHSMGAGTRAERITEWLATPAPASAGQAAPGPLAAKLTALRDEAEGERQSETDPNRERIYLGMRYAFNVAAILAAQPTEGAGQADEVARLREALDLANEHLRQAVENIAKFRAGTHSECAGQAGQVAKGKRLSESAVRQLALVHAASASVGERWEFNQQGLDAFAIDIMDATTERAAAPAYDEGKHALDLLAHWRGKAAAKGYVAVESAIDAAPAVGAAAPADMEHQLIERRICLIPENEGGWHAHVFGDFETPLAKGYGATPSEAVLAATHQPSAQDGGEA